MAHRTQRGLLFITSVLLTAPIILAQKIPDCGGYGDRTCHPFDNEFWVSGSGVCDRGLILDTKNFFNAKDDICVNSTRWREHKDYAWTGWALSQQRYNIGAKEPMNWVTHLSGHNAFNNAADSYIIPNQKLSMTDLLQRGVRSLSIDVHWYANQLRLCHADEFGGGCSTSDRLFAYGMREIGEWLERNEDEAILLRFEDRTKGLQSDYVNDAIQKYFGGVVWTPGRTAASGKARFPTFEEMKAAGEQVLIVSNVTHGSAYIHDEGSGWGFADSKAKNFTLGDTCNANGRDLSSQRTANPKIWTYIYEASTFLDVGDSPGRLGLSDIRRLVNCGTAVIDLDQITANDERRQPFIWSWVENDMGQNGSLAFMRPLDGRWASGKDDKVRRFACMKRRGGDYRDGEATLDPLSYPDKDGHEWRVTKGSGSWNEGFHYCRAEYPGFVYGAPVSGFMNQQLIKANMDKAEIWLNHSLTPVKNIAASPYSLSFTTSEGSAPNAALKEGSRELRVWGIFHAQYQAVSTIQSGQFWFKVENPQGAFGTNGAGIRVTLIPEVVRTLPRGTYTARISVFNPLDLRGVTVNIPISLYVRRGTTAELMSQTTSTNPLPPGAAANFTAKLRYTRDSEFRPTGAVELRELTEAPSTIHPGKTDGSVAVLGRKIVNPTDGSDTPDDTVSFTVHFTSGGYHRVAAVYMGDGDYSASLSPEALVRTQWRPDVGLETSGPSRPDQPFTMKATMRFPDGNAPPSPPTGVVQFWVNGTQVGSAQLINGIAQLETSVKTAGRVPIKAVYAGDGGWFAASESFPGLTHLVQNNSSVDVEFISIPFPGYPILVEGVQYMTPVTLKLQSLTQYRISAPAMHDNGDGTRRLFSTWSDDGAREHTIIAPRVSERYKVYTSGQIHVQAFVNPVGLGTIRITPPSNDGWYPVGTRFQFEAVPGSASLFTFFSGAIKGSTNPQQITLYEPANVLANFVATTSTEPRPPGPSLIASIDAKGGAPEARVWRFRIANTGGPAASAQISRVKFTQTGGTGCTTPPALVSALPLEVPALTSGVSFASVTIDFAGCVSAARFSVEVTTQSGSSTFVTTISNQYR